VHRSELELAFDRREPLLKLLASELEGQTVQALSGVSHVDRVYFRAKGGKSFLDKAVSERYVHPLQELEDQVGGRVLTFFRDDIEVVTAALRAWFGSVEVSTKEPPSVSEFGYESKHLVCVIPEHGKPIGWSDLPEMPNTFEMQIRTLFMHAWAEPQHDPGYKEKDLDTDTKKELAWIAASAWGADRMMNEIYLRSRP
jgi:ppGpp synthetase/RelA/SpoT-type nucleotidyltranferase